MSHDENLNLPLQNGESDEAFCRGMNGLSLAFIGDAVYELMVRTHIISKSETRVQQLHADAVRFANAGFQAQAAEVLMPYLTDEELGIFKRGRNAHTSHTPKNKTEAEYHKATGFEALFGYLFLLKRYERMEYFFGILTDL